MNKINLDDFTPENKSDNVDVNNTCIGLSKDIPCLIGKNGPGKQEYVSLCGNEGVALLTIGDVSLLLCEKCINKLKSNIDSFLYRRRYK